jgi:hypothetical protein
MAVLVWMRVGMETCKFYIENLQHSYMLIASSQKWYIELDNPKGFSVEQVIPQHDIHVTVC